MSILKQLSKKREGQKGFTLIELLIVVAILGILAAVIIPNVNGFLTTGNLNAANTEVENVKTAAMAYFADNGFYPADTDALVNSVPPYISGRLRAKYKIEPDGFLSAAVDPTQSGANPWPATIEFVGFTANMTSGHWERK